MRILFIYFNKEFRPRVPYSLALLETICKQAGHETRVFDTSFYTEFTEPWEFEHLKAGIWKVVDNLVIEPKKSDPHADLAEMVRSFDPQVVALSSYATMLDLQKEVLTPLKKEFPHLKVLAGGVQVTLNPEAAIQEAYTDMICVGEGESVILEVCNRIEAEQSLEGIPGLWTKDGDTIHRNGIAPLTNIEATPILDLDSYDDVQIYGLYEGRAYRMGHIESTRGCPYNCSYCGSGTIRKVYKDAGQGGYIRHKSPRRIVDECVALKNKYNIEMFYFQDGTFTAKPLDLMEELAHLYRDEVGLPFFGLVRPETISKRMAELLKIMGCVHVSIGVESGVESYRKEVLGRHMTNQQILDSIAYLREEKIHVSAYNMIGLPGMDRAHVFETIALNKAAGADSSIVSIFLPFPDNELTKVLLEKGLLSHTNIKSHHGTVPSVEIAEMNEAEITGLFNTFNLYVKAPTFLYPLIRLLEGQSLPAAQIRKLLYRLIK